MRNVYYVYLDLRNVTVSPSPMPSGVRNRAFSTARKWHKKGDQKLPFSATFQPCRTAAKACNGLARGDHQGEGQTGRCQRRAGGEFKRVWRPCGDRGSGFGVRERSEVGRWPSDKFNFPQMFFLSETLHGRHVWQPRADVYRTPEGWLVKLELAGVRLDEIRLATEDVTG